MRRVVAVVAASVALVVLAALPTAAHQRTVLDPDDTEGRVDIVAARHRHRTVCWSGTGGGGCATRVIFKLVAYDRWTYEDVSGGKNFISFELNLDQDEAIERCVVVRSHLEPGGALGWSATIYKGCNYFDDRVIKTYGPSHITIEDAHSIRVRVGKRALLGRGPVAYNWRAVTSFQDQDQSSPCAAPEPHGDGGYGTCVDFTDWKRHRF